MTFNLTLSLLAILGLLAISGFFRGFRKPRSRPRFQKRACINLASEGPGALRQVNTSSKT